MEDHDAGLRDLWCKENQDQASLVGEESLLLPVHSRLPGEGFRRRLLWDLVFKLIVTLAVPAAWSLLTGYNPVFDVLLAGLFALCLGLGLWQWVWIRSWPMVYLHQDLQTQLREDLRRWHKRGFLLAFLLGATPALAWQLHQIVYYAMSKGQLAPSGLVSWLFFIAGGPVLWGFSAWVSQARLRVWLLQIEQTLETFSEEGQAQLTLARGHATRRTWTLILALVVLLVCGVMLLALA